MCCFSPIYNNKNDSENKDNDDIFNINNNNCILLNFYEYVVNLHTTGARFNLCVLCRCSDDLFPLMVLRHIYILS